jgi:hypothetical protein
LNLAHLDEERTHRRSVDLEDGTGVIDLFITITVTTALQEATNDGENAANVALDVIPSRLTEEDIRYYVRNKKKKEKFHLFFFFNFE